MKNLVSVILLIFIASLANAQEYDFGKVSIEEVKDNVYEQDTSAHAAILYKNRKTYFGYEHPDGWIIITEVHKRVKILDKDGLDYATEEIALYKSNKSKERISHIKGITYNENNGKLDKVKLKKSGVFTENMSTNWDKASFTMPEVKVGSVVEWTYKVTSPFWRIDDLVIQEDIPTDYYLAKIQIPEYFNFKKMVKGGFSINPKEYMERRKMKASFEESGSQHQRVADRAKSGGNSPGLTRSTQEQEIEIRELNTEIDLVNIPAMEKEAFVNNIDNYRLIVTYELASVVFPGGGSKVYSTTWDDVVKTINDNEDFGGQLNKTKFLEADVQAITSASSGQNEVIKNAFNHIKQKMVWNREYGIICDQSLNKAYKEGKGSVAEINLMLVNLLRQSGLKANPVLISTRKHGIPVFPTLDGFNYVVAAVEHNGRDILLDATDDLNAINQLPERALNWEGTLVYQDGTSRKINLFPARASKYDTMMNVKISEDGLLTGKLSASMSGLDAHSYRDKYKSVSQEKIEEFLTNSNDYSELSDFEIKNLLDISQSVVESYQFEVEDAFEIVGNEIYFSPLFHLALDENPFKSENRYFPVDFVYPKSRRKMITITIPEGYKVTSSPQPVKYSLPNNLGSFLFNISQTETGLNLMTEFKLNTAIVPTQYYKDLKEFYNQRILKETEKVVLEKQ